MVFKLTPPENLKKPLVDNANATLTFEIATDFVVEASTGNLIPGNTNTAEFQAIMHSTESIEREQHSNTLFELNGRALRAEWIRGRITSPKVFPPEIGTGSVGNLTINGRTGDYVLIIPIQNPYSSSIHGTLFYGRFQEN